MFLEVTDKQLGKVLVNVSHIVDIHTFNNDVIILMAHTPDYRIEESEAFIRARLGTRII